MEVKITEYVYDIKQVIDFLNKMPPNVPAHAISMGNKSGVATITVAIQVYDAGLIECGDHKFEAGKELPQDLLIDLHYHD